MTPVVQGESNATARAAARAEELFQSHRQRHFVQTDRLFMILMLIQWVAGVLFAVLVTPRTWLGSTSSAHLQIWGAVFLGSAISGLPVYMVLYYPGQTVTRHVIAVAQMLWSALLIHLSGGRIETHAHVLGSLAFLAFYRDWRILVSATVVVVIDRVVRGIWYPQSIYGVFVASPYRWIEHMAWAVFEDVFLVILCRRGVAETYEICHRQAMLELAKEHTQREVHLRTADLREANARLQAEIAERTRAEAERDQTYRELVEASRKAGMSDVATGVLHNVGNVLNSINVSAQLLSETIRRSHMGGLRQALDLVQEHRENLAEFLSRDQKGMQLLEYLQTLAETLDSEHSRLRDELEPLISNVDHVKAIVQMQQSYARLGGARERFLLTDAVEDALKINDAGLVRHRVSVVRDYRAAPVVMADRHKVLQILVNLISNAKYALSIAPREDKQLVLRVDVRDDQPVVQVQDNGVGIRADHMTKIFTYGFTTKKESHGFGLHSSALAAKALGGTLSAESRGPGCGALFTLTLPSQGSDAAWEEKWEVSCTLLETATGESW